MSWWASNFCLQSGTEVVFAIQVIVDEKRALQLPLSGYCFYCANKHERLRMIIMQSILGELGDPNEVDCIDELGNYGIAGSHV